MSDGPRVKGQTFKSVMLFLREELTPEQFGKLLESLPADERLEATGTILATSTFPMSLVNHLTTEGARVTARPLPEFASDMGRFAAREGVRGVYRFLVRVLTPDALLTKATSVWSAMNTVGMMSMMKEGPNTAIVRLNSYPAEPVMCMRVIGWIEQLAEMTGAKNVSVTHARCTAKGAHTCDWLVTWE